MELGRWPVGSLEEQGREERWTVHWKIWDNYRRVRKGVKRRIVKEKKELRERTVMKISEQGGTSCKLLWTDMEERGSSEG